MRVNTSETRLRHWTVKCWEINKCLDKLLDKLNPIGAAGRGSGACGFQRVKRGVLGVKKNKIK